jgi:transposase
VCHAGSAKMGFIPESKWIFHSRPQMRDSDYHSEVNADSFKDWFVKRFLNYLEEESIINMDNASYHSTIIDKVPNTRSRKKIYSRWLRKNRIDYDHTETIPELLLRVAPYKSREKVYELDQIANEMGHLVIRLPLYHCQYNPIELIWTKVKVEVSQLNNQTVRC